MYSDCYRSLIPHRRFFEHVRCSDDPASQRAWNACWEKYEAAGQPFGPTKPAAVVWLTYFVQTTGN